MQWLETRAQATAAGNGKESCPTGYVPYTDLRGCCKGVYPKCPAGSEWTYNDAVCFFESSTARPEELSFFEQSVSCAKVLEMQISSSGSISTAATAAAAAVAPAISEIGERISTAINDLDVPGIDLVDSDGVLPYVNAAIDAASTQVAGVQMLQEQVDASLDEVIHMQHALWACGALAWNSTHSTFDGDTFYSRTVGLPGKWSRSLWQESFPAGNLPVTRV